MCWAKKCCFFVKLDLGCVLLGVSGCVISAIMIVSSAVLLQIDSSSVDRPDQFHWQKYLPAHTVRIIEYMTLALGIMMLAASALLIFGVSKKKPGFILCYFVCGIFFTIVVKLSALLLLLSKMWELALGLSLITLVYIHLLVVVHTAYDAMSRGFDHYRLDEDEQAKELA